MRSEHASIESSRAVEARREQLGVVGNLQKALRCSLQ